jgi:hypothetical protein
MAATSCWRHTRRVRRTDARVRARDRIGSSRPARRRRGERRPGDRRIVVRAEPNVHGSGRLLRCLARRRQWTPPGPGGQCPASASCTVSDLQSATSYSYTPVRRAHDRSLPRAPFGPAGSLALARNPGPLCQVRRPKTGVGPGAVGSSTTDRLGSAERPTTPTRPPATPRRSGQHFNAGRSTPHGSPLCPDLPRPNRPPCIKPHARPHPGQGQEPHKRRLNLPGRHPTGNTYRSSLSFSVSGTVTVAGGAIPFTPTRS